MNTEYIKEKDKKTGKETRKLLPIFIILMVCCIAIGFFAGKAIRRFEMSGTLESVKKAIEMALKYSFPVIYIVLILLLVVVGIPILVKSIGKVKKWEGEDEDYIVNVEKSFGWLVNYSTISSILSLGLFTINTLLWESQGSDIKKTILIINIVCLAFDIIFTIFIQAKALKYLKLINPEKKGNIFSFKFNKEWIDSCDEAQKYNMYRAAFKAHKTVNIVCVVMFLFVLIVGLGFKTGIMPAFCVLIIWLADIIVYIREGARLER